MSVQSFGFSVPVRMRRVNTTGNKECFDVVEKPSRGLWIVRSPEFLERVENAQASDFASSNVPC